MTFIFFVLFALVADPPREATITVTLQCPACEPTSACPVCYPCIVDWAMYRTALDNDVWLLTECLTGPHVQRPDEDDSAIWGYRLRDPTDPQYFKQRICRPYDIDMDGDVDLEDVQWSRMFRRGQEVVPQ